MRVIIMGPQGAGKVTQAAKLEELGTTHIETCDLVRSEIKSETEPLKDYYEEQGILVSVDASQGMDEVTEDVLKSVRGKG